MQGKCQPKKITIGFLRLKALVHLIVYHRTPNQKVITITGNLVNSQWVPQPESISYAISGGQLEGEYYILFKMIGETSNYVSNNKMNVYSQALKGSTPLTGKIQTPGDYVAPQYWTKKYQVLLVSDGSSDETVTLVDNTTCQGEVLSFTAKLKGNWCDSNGKLNAAGISWEVKNSNSRWNRQTLFGSISGTLGIGKGNAQGLTTYNISSGDSSSSSVYLSNYANNVNLDEYTIRGVTCGYAPMFAGDPRETCSIVTNESVFERAVTMTVQTNYDNEINNPSELGYRRLAVLTYPSSNGIPPAMCPFDFKIKSGSVTIGSKTVSHSGSSLNGIVLEYSRGVYGINDTSLSYAVENVKNGYNVSINETTVAPTVTATTVCQGLVNGTQNYAFRTSFSHQLPPGSFQVGSNKESWGVNTEPAFYIMNYIPKQEYDSCSGTPTLICNYNDQKRAIDFTYRYEKLKEDLRFNISIKGYDSSSGNIVFGLVWNRDDSSGESYLVNVPINFTRRYIDSVDGTIKTKNAIKEIPLAIKPSQDGIAMYQFKGDTNLNTKQYPLNNTEIATPEVMFWDCIVSAKINQSELTTNSSKVNGIADTNSVAFKPVSDDLFKQRFPLGFRLCPSGNNMILQNMSMLALSEYILPPTPTYNIEVAADSPTSSTAYHYTGNMPGYHQTTTFSLQTNHIGKNLYYKGANLDVYNKNGTKVNAGDQLIYWS